ncbi:uncharacterized protein [Embiotoca jacksoni]|uniref:uncharacterized protein n=1 Tax=Embiotoca jacksoni TaxID=100190 RepID=UPI003703ECE4
MLRFYVLFVLVFRAYGALLYANPGDNVTLPCYYVFRAKHLCWYKQVAGQQPQILSSFYKHSPDSNIFHNQFKDNKRFTIDSGEGFYHLSISNVQELDSAMYFCGEISITVTNFKKGIFLLLNESGRRSFPQQPESNSVQPGGSATLNCTVPAGARDGEYNVYWFKKDSENFGIMYVNTQSSRQCVKNSTSPGCECSLSMRNLSQSDAGTYYCAVASCGEILFGNGARLSVEEKQSVLVPCVVAALVASVVLNIVLCGFLCQMNRRNYLHSEGSHPDHTADSQNEDVSGVQYAAPHFKKRQDTSNRQRNTEVVYSVVNRSGLE